MHWRRLQPTTWRLLPNDAPLARAPTQHPAALAPSCQRDVRLHRTRRDRQHLIAIPLRVVRLAARTAPAWPSSPAWSPPSCPAPHWWQSPSASSHETACRPGGVRTSCPGYTCLPWCLYVGILWGITKTTVYLPLTLERAFKTRRPAVPVQGGGSAARSGGADHEGSRRSRAQAAAVPCDGVFDRRGRPSCARGLRPPVIVLGTGGLCAALDANETLHGRAVAAV